MRGPPAIPAEKRLRKVLSALRGEFSVAEDARREGVPEQVIGNWKRLFPEGGKGAVEAGGWKLATRGRQREVEVADQSSMLGDATVENLVWRKSEERRLGPARLKR